MDSCVWIYISGLSHNDHRVETVNLGIKWSHQLGLQVVLGSCSRGLQHCRAAAIYPFCSKYGRQLLPRPARCGVPMQPPASSPPFQPLGAHHQMSLPRLAGGQFPASYTPPVSLRLCTVSDMQNFRFHHLDIHWEVYPWKIKEEMEKCIYGKLNWPGKKKVCTFCFCL